MAVNPTNFLANAAAVTKTGAAEKKPTVDFGDVLSGAVKNIAETQKKAETMTIKVAQGENIPLQDVIQAVSEAEMTLQTFLTVRDKAIEAYQEVIRTPI